MLYLQTRLPRTRNRDAAFTLVEVMIVIVVLGVLAAIVVPQFADASLDAQVASIRAIVETTQRRIDVEHHKLGDGYPAAVAPSWFAGGTLPTHPQNMFAIPSIETVNTAGKIHPDAKVLTAGSAGAYWYNAAEGVFRARVVDQGSAAATLELYNRVNNSSESDLGTYDGESSKVS